MKMKPAIKPLVKDEEIKLPCGKTVSVSNIAMFSKIIVFITNADVIHNPVNDTNFFAVRQESIKPLIELLQRAEKTFQKR
jgi:hypothetical protein